MEMGSVAADGIVLDNESFSAALRDITHDVWQVGKMVAPRLDKWAALGAFNFQDMIRKVDSKVATAVVIPFYAEYMDAVSVEPDGFCLEGACVLYDTRNSDTRVGRHLRQAAKSET